MALWQIIHFLALLCTIKCCFEQEILVLDVELIDGIVGEHVARAAYAGDVRVVVEYLEQDRTVDLALGILVNLQFNQVGGRHLLAGHGVGLILLEKPNDFIQVVSFA